MSAATTRACEYRTRAVEGSDVTIRSEAGSAPRFTGHAVLTDVRTTIGDPTSWGFYEEIAPEALTRVFSQPGDVRLLVNHASQMVVARQSAGDLRLTVDGAGLAVDADLDTEVSYIRDLSRNLEKRRITGMSFGFMVLRDVWSTIDLETTDDQGRTFSTKADLRRVLDMEVMEVSAVTFPAYTETDAALRAIASSPDAVKRRADRLYAARAAEPAVIGRCLDLLAELRAGKTLSAANMTLLTGVLANIADADVALDAATTDLSNVLGVPNPDDDKAEAKSAPAAATPDGPAVPVSPVRPADLIRATGARYGLT